MIKLLLSVPLILVAIWAVYEKGNPHSKLQKGFVMGFYGACISALLLPLETSSLVPGAFMTAALLLGLSLGLGNAVGPAIMGTPPDKKNKEVWQFGPLLTNTWLALAGLGFFRAIFAPAFLGIGQQTEFILFAGLLVVCSTAAMPLAILVALKRCGGPIGNTAQAPSPEWEEQTARSNAMWKWQDWTYGGIMGISALTISFFI